MPDDLTPRDRRRLADCLSYAQSASRPRQSDHSELAVLLARLHAGRREQLARLRARETAAEPPQSRQLAERGEAAVEEGDARLLSREFLTPDLLRLRIARPAGFRYAAGQHVKLALGGVRRSYSLVSAPHETELELFIELYPGGAMSERLRTLPEGAVLELSAAKGGLALSAAPRHLMVATVTGVAPFVSLLRDAFHYGRGGEFHLLHGASYYDELGYAAELAGLAESGRLRYLPAVSRPSEQRNAGWQGATGRVADLVGSYLRQMNPADTTLYACGHAGMVAAVADLGRAAGYRVRLEPY